MGEYLTKRLLLALLTLFLASIGVFSLVRFLPGDVITMLTQALADVKTVEALRHRLGLDQAIHIQFLNWFWDALRGDLGSSLWTGRAVISDLAQRIPVTMELTLLALFISFVVAIPVGIIAAIRQDSLLDYFTRSAAIITMSAPHFWVATMVLTFTALYFRWSPPLIYTSITKDPVDHISQFLIPASILGLYRTGAILRMTRSMLLEVLRQDYVRTAWAKGLRERTVIYRHALKNAMIPVVTIISLQLPAYFGGAVIIETIFGLPGMGRLLVDSLNYRDYPVIQGITFFFAFFMIMVNLLVDLSYSWLNPRVRYK